MSQRSKISALSSDPPTTDEQVYNYALRVAYLTHLLQPKPTPSTEAVAAQKADSKSKHGSESWTHALYSIGDIFKDSGGKSSSKEVRLPEKFVKVLGTKIETIAMGRDTTYSEPTFRSTIGAFYTTYSGSALQRQLKENRKVEELIIAFVTTATAMLKKRSTGDEWKGQLMGQVGTFVAVVRDCLKSPQIRNPPPELLNRLEVYLTGLSPPVGDGASSSSSRSLETLAPASTVGAADMDLVRQVANIFGVSDEDLARDLSSIKRFCTEKAALQDLKSCISMVNQGRPFPGRREDFDSDDSYAVWRKVELETVQQLILALATFKREVVQTDRATSMRANGAQSPPSSPKLARPSSLAKRNSVIPSFSANDSDEGSEDASNDFVYIPSNPRKVYERLLEYCLNFDLEVMRNLAADEEVSLRILSKLHQDLLFECALRWRIMLPFRVVCFLSEIGKRYASSEIPIIHCVVEALGDVDKVIADWDYDLWTVRDRNAFYSVLSDLFDTMLRRFYEIVQSAEAVEPSEVSLLMSTVEIVYANPVFVEFANDLEERFIELREAISAVAAHQYAEQRDGVPVPSTAEAHVADMLRLLAWLRSAVAKVEKRFKAPILGRVDVTAWYVASASPVLVRDLALVRNAVEALLSVRGPPERVAENERDVRNLFEAARELTVMHDAYCPECVPMSGICFDAVLTVEAYSSPLKVDFSWFEGYVHKWLTATNEKTMDWVQEAVRVDNFVPEGNDRQSSSIVDVIESCKSAVAFIQNLNWPDPYVNALFLTSLSQTISKAVEEYCNKIEGLFMKEMFATPVQAPRDDERSSAWLLKFRGLYQSEKPVEPFTFEPACLVKLNNIQAARDLLDKMYTAVDADRVSDVVKAVQPDAPGQARGSNRFLFTIKVVLGEALVAKDETSNLNPFLTLSDSNGRRIAKTRTLYDSAYPRWSETFDVSVEGSLWLAATVYDRNLVEDHDLLGRAFVHLHPSLYSDFLPRELWLDLDSHGRVLLRVSMEGEKDDIQFYFGRAFRSLKRTEADMVRIIVDKIAPLVRQALSRPVLKSLVRKGGFTFDVKDLQKDLQNLRINDRFKDIRLDRFKAMFGSGGSSIPEIPPVPEEDVPPPNPSTSAPAPDARKTTSLTDRKIEDAIGPLFEYFEETFAILHTTLNDAAFANVMHKIWKEILTVLEGLLVPPLSDQPAEMRPLSETEVYIVTRWLKGLADFFHANGQGVPLEDLDSARFRQITVMPFHYFMDTDNLMIECNRAVNSLLAATSAPKGRKMTRSKSVYMQRNLGTIRQRRREKRQADPVDPALPEMMLRILRMRSGTEDFLSQQMRTLQTINAQNKAPATPHRRAQSDARSGLERRGGTNRLSAASNREGGLPSPRLAVPPANDWPSSRPTSPSV